MKTFPDRLGLSWTGFAQSVVAILALAVSISTAKAETTIYVSEHYEVRDHDEPVKYVFNGLTRVARITASLTPNTRVQRLRLNPGWNLCSVAVGGMPLPRRLPGESTDLVTAAHKWNPATRTWAPVQINEPLVAGTVLWVRSTTNAVLAVQGICPEPVGQTVEASGSFHPSAGLTALRLKGQNFGDGSAGFDAADQTWRLRHPGISTADLGSPEFIPPGQAVFIHSETVAKLEAPAPVSRVNYYHQDHLGSSSVMTDAAGTLVEETAYYPFGLPRHEHRLRELEEAYTFTQKERDRESGLHYFEARYLTGGLGRFATIDPKYADPDGLSAGDLGKLLAMPQRLNPYAYVSSNPLKNWDPTGLDEEETSALDTADTIVDRVGFIADMEKVKGGPALDVIGVGIKTIKFAKEPSLMRGVAVGYDASKAVLTAKCPPVGLALQGLDLIGIGPGTFIDWAAKEEDAANAHIAELEGVVQAYKNIGESYAKIAENHQAATVRTKAQIKVREKQIKSDDELLKLMDERLASSDRTLKRARQRR